MCQRTLGDIVTGRSAIRAVRHPLGFLCLPVQRDGPLGVCVHLWNKQVEPADPTTSRVHSHSWDLMSFVLYGEVGNVVMRVDDDPAGIQRIFEVHSHGDTDEIRATSRLVRCTERRRQLATVGRTYELLAGEFHESVLSGTEAATVVLGRSASAIDLSVGPHDTRTHHVVRQRCSSQETVRAVRVAMERLANAASPSGRAW
jgi:hypothetical protein